MRLACFFGADAAAALLIEFCESVLKKHYLHNNNLEKLSRIQCNSGKINFSSTPLQDFVFHFFFNFVDGLIWLLEQGKPELRFSLWKSCPLKDIMYNLISIRISQLFLNEFCFIHELEKVFVYLKFRKK